MKCISCQNNISAGDMFCGFCGVKKIIIENRPLENASLNKMIYRQEHYAYINSLQWEHKKDEISSIYRQKNWSIECVRCRSKYNLQLHHNYYVKNYTQGNENISDLDYLCTDCHDQWHTIQKESGHSQNILLEPYFKFISNNILGGNTNALVLLAGKVHMDEVIISKYFSRDEVVEYQKIISRYNWMMLGSLLLIFFYGIGLLLIFFPMIAIGRTPKPKDYDIFQDRMAPLSEKKVLIAKINPQVAQINNQSDFNKSRIRLLLIVPGIVILCVLIVFFIVSVNSYWDSVRLSGDIDDSTPVSTTDLLTDDLLSSQYNDKPKNIIEGSINTDISDKKEFFGTSEHTKQTETFNDTQTVFENADENKECEKIHGPSTYKSVPKSLGGGAYCDCKQGYVGKPILTTDGTPSMWCFKE